ncbi:MAG: hypothetical protein ACL7AX_10020 [Candidatus Arsenophonus phytopathogenicus]
MALPVLTQNIFLAYLLADTYFPDNPVREARAHEIAVDCQTYASKNALLIKEIQNNVVELNNHLKELYQKEINDEEIKFEKFSFDTLNFEIPKMLAPIITANIVSESITVGATSDLVSTGEIGATAMVELVGLSASFEIASMAASGGATIGVVLAIGSVVGKIKRDKLAIHDGYQSRYKLAKAANINHSISSIDKSNQCQYFRIKGDQGTFCRNRRTHFCINRKTIKQH